MSNRHADEVRAHALMENGEYVESARIFEELAKCDSKYSLNSLAWMHYSGVLGSVNIPKAIELWEKIANYGDLDAHESLGMAYYSLRNYTKSAYYWKALGAGASGEALSYLGWMYYYGKLGVSDKSTANKLWAEASAKGASSADFYLGHSSLDAGMNIAALENFRRGAERGDKACMYWAGNLLAFGRSIQTNRDEAIAWLLKAEAAGEKSATLLLLALRMKETKSISEYIWLLFKCSKEILKHTIFRWLL